MLLVYPIDLSIDFDLDRSILFSASFFSVTCYPKLLFRPPTDVLDWLLTELVLRGLLWIYIGS